MKKLMFSALACVAFAFSGFASNEVVNEEKVSNENIVIETKTDVNEIKITVDSNFRVTGNCNYTLTRTFRGFDGKYYTQSKSYTTDAKSATDCAAIANNHATRINLGLEKF